MPEFGGELHVCEKICIIDDGCEAYGYENGRESWNGRCCYSEWKLIQKIRGEERKRGRKIRKEIPGFEGAWEKCINDDNFLTCGNGNGRKSQNEGRYESDTKRIRKMRN